MKVVKVYGELKKRLGQGRFELEVETPAEAIRALCANFSGLQKWFIDSEQDGIGYKVQVGKDSIEESNVGDLHLPWSEKDVFSITPVIAGAGGGFGRVLFGALLIGMSFVTFGASTAFAGGTGAGLSGGAMYAAGAWGSKAMGLLGLSLVLGGVSEMISPTPDFPDMKQANTLTSFSFSGVTNTAQIGTPVPIAYGRLFVGSSVISSGLDVDQVL